jgi:sialate O-acetylesterase
MISSWRQYWTKGTGGAIAAQFPFGYMQLSTWGDHQNATCGDRVGKVNDYSCDVAVVRWGQSANVGYVPNPAMPNTFQAVAVDLGDPGSPFGDIHPRYKQQMAARLALSADAVAYANPKTPLAATTGPIPTAAAAAGSTVQITFKNGGGKLTLKHHVGFEVSAKACDMTFPEKDTAGWTEASIASATATTVTVTAPAAVPHPMCIRYNWYQAACRPAVGPELCAIYGESADWTLGQTLPAAPFIMDVK